MNKVNYSALELERNSEIRANFESIFRRRDIGNPNSLRGIILSHVLEAQYELAITELETYAEGKVDYPSFEFKAQKYLRHCKELILAIQGKREFQGLSNLPVTKQRDMFEKIVNHYEELKNHIKRIETIGHETLLDDIRSTTIVLKTFIFCLFSILLLALLMDLFGNIIITYDKVALDVSGDMSGWLADFLGL